MAEDGKNLTVNDCNCFERDRALVRGNGEGWCWAGDVQDFSLIHFVQARRLFVVSKSCFFFVADCKVLSMQARKLQRETRDYDGGSLRRRIWTGTSCKVVRIGRGHWGSKFARSRMCVVQYSCGGTAWEWSLLFQTIAIVIMFPCLRSGKVGRLFACCANRYRWCLLSILAPLTTTFSNLAFYCAKPRIRSWGLCPSSVLSGTRSTGWVNWSCQLFFVRWLTMVAFVRMKGARSATIQDEGRHPEVWAQTYH